MAFVRQGDTEAAGQVTEADGKATKRTLLPDKAKTAAYTAILPKLNLSGQALLLSALADRGDKTALSAVTVSRTVPMRLRASRR